MPNSSPRDGDDSVNKSTAPKPPQVHADSRQSQQEATQRPAASHNALNPDSENPTEVIPKAITRPLAQPVTTQGRISKLWVLTAICALVSIVLFWWSNQSTGDRIIVRFEEGHGIKPEDRLRHKGIDIGRVERVALDESMRRVEVHIRLPKETRSLVRKGSRFWIVRPVVSTETISGLETILGAKFIAIEPGPLGSELASEFDGLESAPALAPRDGAVEIVLDSQTRGGLDSGAPLLYRGFKIGQVLSVGLAIDAKTVRTRCAIDPEYRQLIRQNTVFWNRSGWRVDIGITGIKLDADTVSQIVSGGIEMATPENAGAIVNTGHRFVLHEKAEDEWLQWKPSLAHGTAWSSLESKLLQPSRLALRWQERSFGFRRNKQQLGWCVPLSDGSIVSLDDLVRPKTDAIADTGSIEIEGQSIKSTDVMIKGEMQSRCARYTLPQPLPSTVSVWPKDDIYFANPNETRSIVVVSSEAKRTTAIDAARLSSDVDGTWKIDPSIVLGNDILGLPVIDVETGKLLGLIGTADNTNFVHLLRTQK